MKTLGILFMGVGVAFIVSMLTTFSVSTIPASGVGLIGAGFALLVAGTLNCIAAWE